MYKINPHGSVQFDVIETSHIFHMNLRILKTDTGLEMKGSPTRSGNTGKSFEDPGKTPDKTARSEYNIRGKFNFPGASKVLPSPKNWWRIFWDGFFNPPGKKGPKTPGGEGGF